MHQRAEKDLTSSFFFPILCSIMPKITLAEVLPTRGKLTEKDVREIRVLFAQGAAKSKLARAYGVSRQTITYHIRRQVDA